MAVSTLTRASCAELRLTLERAVGSIEVTIGELVGREIQVAVEEVQRQDPTDILRGLTGPLVVARGEMDQGYEGQLMLTAFALPDAITMAGLLMMTPDHVITERRDADRLNEEDREAFGELGNVLYSGVTDAVSERVEDFAVRMQAQGYVTTDADEGGLLGDGGLVTISFGLRIGDLPETRGLIAIDVDTAVRWNGAPIELVEEAPPPTPPEEEGLEDIPAAPIRGALAAYVTQTDVFRLLRRSGRRVGLDVRRHGRGEVPNPSAHRDEIVLVDVPVGEEKRFGWCSRIKELSPTTKVVVLLHHASRARVTQAFLARADAILAYPCAESELSQKLAPLVDRLSQPAATPRREG